MGALFHAIGGPAFSFASIDYMHKVHSLRDAAAEHPALETVVAFDREAGRLRTQGSRARNLWRVLNALRFVQVLLDGLVDEEAPLRPLIQSAYDETMAATHIWAIRQAVWLALFAAPSRATFVESLSQHGGHSRQQMEAAAARYVAASKVVIARLDALYPEPCVDAEGN
jgi:hypothetical protein